MKHTLIFIPSYFDFVRLRNYFKKQEMKFVHICEYTEVSLDQYLIELSPFDHYRDV